MGTAAGIISVPVRLGKRNWVAAVILFD